MYNRYIPQSDGTYRRSPVPERPSPPPTPECAGKPQQLPHPQNIPCPPEPVRRPEPHPRQRNPRPKPCPERREESALSFLRNLVPRNLDTGDLFIIVLLLLMAGDCPEDQNNALLTLAIYLFL